eukprot:8425397-Ditylum_brightwellii.AAC.1
MAYVFQEGPYCLGGAAIMSLVDIQGIKQIKNFLCHMRMDSDIGIILEIAYAWAQHQIGLNVSILDGIITPLPNVEARWLKSLQKDLKKIYTTIEVCKDPSYQLHWYGDVHLMPK